MSKIPKTTAAISEGIGTLHFGAQLAVYKDDQLIVNQGFGQREVDDVMLWMSAVKPLTAIIIAQLTEQSELRLDTPVAEILPGFGQNGKEEITVHHLLTHTGGFRSPAASWKPKEVEGIIQRILDAPLEEHWVPGEKAGYHVDSSWYILGAIAEELSGRQIQTVIREEICEPLGMSRSGLGIPVDRQPTINLSPVYQRSGKELKQVELFSHPDVVAMARPGGNGRGPANELARFYFALLTILKGKDGILQEDTLQRFTSIHRRGLYDHTFRHDLDWCLGFIPDNNHHGIDTVPYGYGPHCSPRTFGHSGNQCSVAFADPEHDLAVALIFDGMPGEPRHQPRVRSTLAALYEDLGLT